MIWRCPIKHLSACLYRSLLVDEPSLAHCPTLIVQSLLETQVLVYMVGDDSQLELNFDIEMNVHYHSQLQMP